MDAREMDVVLGAGPVGLAVARTLVASGRRVRLVSRRGSRSEEPAIETARADANRPDELATQLRGCAVLYQCAKPPYARWPELFPALIDGVIEAAAETGVRIVHADNLYMYGETTGPIREDSPVRPVGPKGHARALVAEKLLEAHRRGRIQVSIGRAADFFGPNAREAVIGERVVPRALEGRPAELIGDIDQPHTHIFVDDFARGLVVLGQQGGAAGGVWHVPAAPTRTTRELVSMIFEAAGRRPRYRVAGGRMVRMLAPFNSTLRELKEVLYQVEKPFVVDHSKFASAFGESTTPHEIAVRDTVMWWRALAVGPVDASAGESGAAVERTRR